MSKSALIFWADIPGTSPRQGLEHADQGSDKVLKELKGALVLDLARELSHGNTHDSYYFHPPFLHDGVFKFGKFCHENHLNFIEFQQQDTEAQAFDYLLHKGYQQIALVYPIMIGLDNFRLTKALDQIKQSEAVFWPLDNKRICLVGLRSEQSIWPIDHKDAIFDMKQKTKNSGITYAFMKPPLAKIENIQDFRKLWLKIVGKELKLTSKYQYLKNTYRVLKKHHKVLNLKIDA